MCHKAALGYLQSMLRIGLTGGIGSGKSTVAHRFAQLGIPIIDADAISHQLVKPGETALAAIVAHFGTGILNADGSLNRKQLRETIFSNPEQRKSLEAILHPRIRKAMLEQLAGLDSAYCILSIPLLIEGGWHNELDRILVIDAPHELQIERAMNRDGVTMGNIQAIIDGQIDSKSRLAAADDILSNDSDIAALLAQVDKLHEKYLSLSQHASEI